MVGCQGTDLSNRRTSPGTELSRWAESTVPKEKGGLPDHGAYPPLLLKAWAGDLSGVEDLIQQGMRACHPVLEETPPPPSPPLWVVCTPRPLLLQLLLDVGELVWHTDSTLLTAQTLLIPAVLVFVFTTPSENRGQHNSTPHPTAEHTYRYRS